jgi:hypothetical protein
VSLGAQAGFYAPIVNDYNIPVGQDPLLKSSLAICPVVDLNATMHDLFNSGLKSTIAHRILFAEISRALKALPILGQVLSPIFQSKVKQIPENVGIQAASHYARKKPGWAPRPFHDVRIATPEELWKANQFLNYAHYPTATSTLAFAAKDDSVVPTSFNAAKLKEMRNSGSRNQLDVVTVSHGDHCAFSLTYGWQTISALFRGFVLSNSPEMLRRWRVENTSFDANEIPSRLRISQGESYHSISYSYTAGQPYLRVKYSIYTGPNAMGCRGDGPDMDRFNCLRTGNARIPFSAFSGRPAWARTPVSVVEAESLTRWANVNLKPFTSPGKSRWGGRYDVHSGMSWVDF